MCKRQLSPGMQSQSAARYLPSDLTGNSSTGAALQYLPFFKVQMSSRCNLKLDIINLEVLLESH